jgi:hypothetical protein
VGSGSRSRVEGGRRDGLRADSRTVLERADAAGSPFRAASMGPCNGDSATEPDARSRSALARGGRPEPAPLLYVFPTPSPALPPNDRPRRASPCADPGPLLHCSFPAQRPRSHEEPQPIMQWFPFAALIAGVLPLIFMGVGYYFVVRKQRASEEQRMRVAALSRQALSGHALSGRASSSDALSTAVSSVRGPGPDPKTSEEECS